MSGQVRTVLDTHVHLDLIHQRQKGIKTLDQCLAFDRGYNSTESTMFGKFFVNFKYYKFFY